MENFDWRKDHTIGNGNNKNASEEIVKIYEK
jgi:hypothetical protein